MITTPASYWANRSSQPNTASLALVSGSAQAAYYAGASADYNVAGNALSLQQWVKHTALGGTQVYQGQFDFSVNQESYTCYYVNSGGDRLRFRLEDPAGLQDYVQWAIAPPVGAWAHYTFVWDGTLTVATGSMALYVNGVSAGAPAILTANNIVSLKASTAQYAVGAWTGGAAPASYFNGLIDEPRIWTKVLTGPEILANYLTQIDPATANLYRYCRFNNDYTELVAGKNLTGLNAPTFSADVPFS
jgi:hypothetical protein